MYFKTLKLINMQLEDFYNCIKYTPIEISRKDYIENETELEEQAYAEKLLIIIK